MALTFNNLPFTPTIAAVGSTVSIVGTVTSGSVITSEVMITILATTSSQFSANVFHV